MRLKLNVSGIVQGVGFRPFIYRTAVKYCLSGYVRNMGDAGVEILIEGTSEAIGKFFGELTSEKPPLARIDQIKRTELTGQNRFSDFIIYSSSEEAKNSGSVIPPDIAICNQCLLELRNPKNPRYDYFFITCTDCGPRFTIIQRLPYDRENTTMCEFPICGFCQKEYIDPANRRFHAQTIACPDCGPKVYMTDNKGVQIQAKDPIRTAGKFLSKGRIVAIKGYGGFHIAASTMLEEPLLRLRETKHRREKPFAIMTKSIEAARSFGEINLKEQELLTSPQRPIVLLNKNSDYNLSEYVAPNLHNIGVMLPYTGLHYMLFDQVSDTSFVMTSANPANEPIIKDNDIAIKILGGTVDYFLFHNRRIAHRCDDSVMRIHGSSPVFIRRSRGYAPAPIRLKQRTKHCVLGLGGELNDTSTILFDDKAFISQHIGDVENIETQNYLKEATDHLQQLTNTHVEAIACDLHPKFNTTILARELSESKGLPLFQVQHHHAHAAALMAEYGLDEIVAVTCDGYGYGSDGSAWGGEILYCNCFSPEFSRIGHLEPQLLLGGDLASRYPIRLAASMLFKADIDIQSWLLHNSNMLIHGKIEAELILNQLQKGTGGPQTTSCGRVLDAVSALLGICNLRSYEGEPAIKLESTAWKGKDALNLKPQISDNILDTSYLLRSIHDGLGKFAIPNLAYSAHVYLANGLATLAIEQAKEKGTKNVGFSGGVACNRIFAQTMRKAVEAAKLQFYVHESIPAGDGGVSFGQTVVASKNVF